MQKSFGRKASAWIGEGLNGIPLRGFHALLSFQHRWMPDPSSVNQLQDAIAIEILEVKVSVWLSEDLGGSLIACPPISQPKLFLEGFSNITVRNSGFRQPHTLEAVKGLPRNPFPVCAKLVERKQNRIWVGETFTEIPVCNHKAKGMTFVSGHHAFQRPASILSPETP